MVAPERLSEEAYRSTRDDNIFPAPKGVSTKSSSSNNGTGGSGAADRGCGVEEELVGESILIGTCDEVLAPLFASLPAVRE